LNLLTFPQDVLRPCLAALARRPGQPQFLPLGLSHWAGNRELLVRFPGARSGQWLQVVFIEAGRPPSFPGGDMLASVGLGRGEARGLASGVVRVGAGFEPIHHFKWVGPGMHAFSPSPAGGTQPAAPSAGVVPPTLSRTVGALGREEWLRLAGLRVGVVGLGRTGSGVAQLLGRLGLSGLVLIDPDAVEPHNLGEMPWVSAAAVGLPKVTAVASGLRGPAGASAREVTAVADSITHLRGLYAARTCDFLFGCVDHDGARLAVAAVAALYHKPLLDIASGIHGRGDQRRMGVDVRLVLPGRCLRCLGGLRDEPGARRVLASAEAERTVYAARRWQAEREGSLASLNQVAAGVGLRVFEDYVAERVSASTWLRLEFDPSGRLEVSYPAVPPDRQTTSCGVCELAGQGDEGAGLWWELVRAEDGW
jgi:hypothetical protein